MVLFLGSGPPFVNPGDCPSGQHLDSHQEGASLRWSASIPPASVLPLAGSCPLGWGTALGTVTTSPISSESVFLNSPLFLVENFTLFLKGKVSYGYVLLSMLVTKREPTPCYRDDAYSVDTPRWALWGKVG